MTVLGDGALGKLKVTRDANGSAYVRVTGSAPMKYSSNLKRAHSVISWGTWVVGSLPRIISISLVAAFVSLLPDTLDSATLAGIFSSGSHFIDRGMRTKLSLESILFVNAPQVILSLWYLVYNQALMRLIIANEWALFSTAFKPPRVTYPRGQQVSTYFLELSYRYIIPFITSSIIVHWLLSRCFYVFLSEGAYFSDSDAVYKTPDPNLPEGAILNIRFSSAALILVVCLMTSMAIVLVGLSFRKLPGCMPIVGTNSRHIAAACHVSPLSKPDEQPRESRSGSEEALNITPAGLVLADSEIPLMDMRTSQHEQEEEDGDDEEEYHGLDPDTARLIKTSRGLLSWGIFRMPDEWYAAFSDTIPPETAREAGSGLVPRDYTRAHMSFVTPSDNVRPPKDGAWYVFR